MSDSTDLPVYETLGSFYLGRPAADDASESDPEPLLYDAKDLTTHGVIVGMTGSGKTGLGVTLLEEAALDGLPAIVVDPKGDLGNLLLTFPQLRGADFAPWVDPGEATRAGRSVEEHGEAVATLWRDGLAGWQQDGTRIERLRAAAELHLYTPGSTAGRPVSVLSSFAAPAPELLDDADLLQDRIGSTVAALLALLGIDADPVRSRETILLSTLLDDAWRRGESLDLAELVRRVQDPPLDQVGVLPLESFYSSKDRFELAMSLNNLLASPGFRAWITGAPLDLGRILYTDDGRPRIAIFSIAHLSDAERMFFVTLLLEETLSWMRGRSGTSSLRALLYMDEVFGYLPPVSNPPSKRPLLTLLKQARAYGLGLVLSTQNPVDLDYKALSNMGTWFLGRLQTERDKARLMDGLLAADGSVDRGALGEQLSGMPKRSFLLHNVHERGGPQLFKVRWAMSYLRGPLTREQIRRLTPREEPVAASPRAASPASAKPVAAPPARTDERPGAESRPVLPRGVEEVVVPAGRGASGDDATILYRPFVLGQGSVRFVDKSRGDEVRDDVLLLADGEDVDWSTARPLELSAGWQDAEPVAGARWADPPSDAVDAKSHRRWKKELSDLLYRTRRKELAKSPTFDLVAALGESERAFRIRLGEHAREERDRQVEALRAKAERRLERERDQVARAEQRLEKEREQATGQKVQAAIRVGTTVLGALFGGRRRSLATAARGVSRSFREAGDVRRAEETVERELDDVRRLEDELEHDIETLRQRLDAAVHEPFEAEVLTPRRVDVEVDRVALAWVPYRVVDGVAEPLLDAER
ncbi:MAG: DUF87 domain-containing protein [Acidobacteriota bacterium]